MTSNGTKRVWRRVDGVLLLEAGDGQAHTLRELLENAGYARIEEIRDLTGTVRGLAAFLV